MKRYCVIYRTGGKDNYAWKRTLPVTERTDAHSQADDIRKGGRKAIIEDFDASMSIGLPRGYNYEQGDF